MSKRLEHGAGVPTGGVRVRASMPMQQPRSAGSLLLSVLLHAGIIALVVMATARVVEPRGGAIADAILRATGGGGGGGQGGNTFIAVAPPRTAPPPPVLTEQPVLPPPPPTVTPPTEQVPSPAPDSAPAAASAAGAGSGGGTGGGQGTGAGPGSGSGTGPGSGGGSGGGASAGSKGRPPEPRQYMIPPVDIPKSLRGKTVTVSFTIASDGRVTDFDVNPPIADRDYSKKFNEVLRAFRFRPARDSTGEAVASKLNMDVTF